MRYHKSYKQKLDLIQEVYAWDILIVVWLYGQIGGENGYVNRA